MKCRQVPVQLERLEMLSRGFALAYRMTFVTIAGAMVVATSVASAEDGTMAGDHMHQHHHGGDEHAHHAHMMEQQGYTRMEHRYEVPDVVLTNQNGDAVSLRETLAEPKPVLLNFIFTTCTTICPVLSASFAQTQTALGDEAKDVRMISISIDPQHDTPAKLREYAQRFHAGPGWEFLTGDLDDVIAVLKAFDAYRGDKMNHIPLTILRAKPDEPWVRLEGFASARELVREYRSQAAPGGEALGSS
jgi:protein SCO1/2